MRSRSTTATENNLPRPPADAGGLRRGRVFAASGIALLLAGYVAYQARDLIRGPKIRVNEPANYAAFAYPVVSIKGEARRITHLRLNDRQIFTDEKGNFEEKLPLAPGYNIIKLDARDRFGRQAMTFLELVYLKKLENEKQNDKEDQDNPNRRQH